MHMDNFMSHKGQKVIGKCASGRFVPAPYPSDSLDLGPCDFSPFRLLKTQLRDHLQQSSEQVLTINGEIWNDLTFEDV
jgi:hypothetical protein